MKSEKNFISLVELSFIPSKDILLPRFTGSITLSCILNIISTIDKEYAEKLHESKQLKPYSCTPIYPLPNPEKLLPPPNHITYLKLNKKYAMRITIISDNLMTKFLLGLNDLAIEALYFKLMEVPCLINDISVRAYTFNSLEPKVKSDMIKVRFLTPTRFAVRGTVKRKRPKFRLFPVPENLFHSLVHHWNYFAPPESRIPETKFLDYVVNFVYEDDYKIKRETVEIGKGRKAVGFIGYCVYRFYKTKSKWFEIALRLLTYGELINVGNAKSMGLGVIKVEEFQK